MKAIPLIYTGNDQSTPKLCSHITRHITLIDTMFSDWIFPYELNEMVNISSV
jgi:hypothetical protein